MAFLHSVTAGIGPAVRRFGPSSNGADLDLPGATGAYYRSLFLNSVLPGEGRVSSTTAVTTAWMT